MLFITVSNFRKRASFYIDLTKEERVFVTRKDGYVIELVTAECIINDAQYFANKAVCSRLEEGDAQIKNGQTTKMSSEAFGDRFGV